MAETVLRAPLPAPARLVKGSHIVVPRLFDHDRGYILPGPDRRFVFALPFQQDFTLIGTTDEDFIGDPAALTTGLDEIYYLCQSVSAYFRAGVGPDKVLHTYAGVRALYDDGTARAKDATRDYRLMLDRPPRAAPLLTVYGGKITTYRRLAEAALKLLGNIFAAGRPGPPRQRPGGDFVVDGVGTLVARACRSWPFLTEPQAERLVAAYGTRLARVLGEAGREGEIAPWFGADLSSAEVRYLMKYEWAQTADDVLWRRSKLGLTVSEAEGNALTRFMQSAVVEPASPERRPERYRVG